MAKTIPIICLLFFVASRESSASRPIEPLERFSLDELKVQSVVHSVECGALVAVINDPDGYTHLLRVGHYLGKNDGRVEHMDEQQISIVELYETEPGHWIEKEVVLYPRIRGNPRSPPKTDQNKTNKTNKHHGTDGFLDLAVDPLE